MHQKRKQWSIPVSAPVQKHISYATNSIHVRAGNTVWWRDGVGRGVLFSFSVLLFCGSLEERGGFFCGVGCVCGCLCVSLSVQ